MSQMLPELQSSATAQFPAAGLYVHVPFCETKCGYCDFYSVALQGRPTRPLVDALGRELSRRVPAAKHIIRTVFVGGGTPTLLPPADLTALLDLVARHAPVPQLVEYTVEANPATVDGDKAKRLAAAGVNRVSMGAQSFVPSELATLERLHTPADVGPSVETLREAGIPQINIDLIFGIPGQTMASWRESLHRAIQLSVEHIACYGLTYEPATALTARRDRGLITPCDEDLEAEMYDLAVATLADAGFVQYEISNFARPGCESRHNLVYWRNQPYIGVGPSAVGCYAARRYRNVPEVGKYVASIEASGTAEVEVETLTPNTLALELIMMQLRLIEGLNLEVFRCRTGCEFGDAFSDAVQRLSNEGWLEFAGTHVRLTTTGRKLTNFVLGELAAALREGCIPERADS